MNCTICGKPVNEKKTFISSLANDHKTICSVQHVTCFNRQYLTEEDENEDENICQGINIKDKDSLVFHLLKQNGDLQNKIIEMASHSTITNNNNNSFNTTNNAFNLNFFLNETCKDAMNITDFVSNIKMELNDLETTGRIGYVEGISNIIVKNLNNLEQHMRPLHCSDLKREILYIKDNNEWTKETNEKPILTKAIKTIANEKEFLEPTLDILAEDIEEDNEFIVSDVLSSLLMTQLADNPKLKIIFDELFSVEGAVIHIHPISEYLDITSFTQVKVTDLIISCLSCNETFIGYIENEELFLNPEKAAIISNLESVSVVVLS